MTAVDQQQMLEPFNFPGHGTGAHLVSVANMKQVGREDGEPALRGALIGQGLVPQPPNQTDAVNERS